MPSTAHPADPSRRWAEFFDDRSHPNDAGNSAMGEAVDLLRCNRR